MMTDFYNWASNLPATDRTEAYTELASLLGDGLFNGDVTKFEAALAAWRSTGRVHDDPEVLDVVIRKINSGDFVEAEGSTDWLDRHYDPELMSPEFHWRPRAFAYWRNRVHGRKGRSCMGSYDF